MTPKYFLKIEWEHFQVVVTCKALLSLPWQPSFDSQIFQNLFFSYKKIYFYFYLLDYSVILDIILQYFIKFKTISVIIDLRTKHDLKMTNCRCWFSFKQCLCHSEFQNFDSNCKHVYIFIKHHQSLVLSRLAQIVRILSPHLR